MSEVGENGRKQRKKGKFCREIQTAREHGTCILVMSMTSHRMRGRVLTCSRSISAMTTREKSILVIWMNPASYMSAEREELPHPGIKIFCSESAVNPHCSVTSLEMSFQSLYHSNGRPPRALKNASQYFGSQNLLSLGQWRHPLFPH